MTNYSGPLMALVFGPAVTIIVMVSLSELILIPSSISGNGMCLDIVT